MSSFTDRCIGEGISDSYVANIGKFQQLVETVINV